MKNTIKIILIAFFIGALNLPFSSKAQPSSYYTVSWNILFPVGDFSKWVDETSLSGFDFGAQYFVTDGITAGFNIGSMRVDGTYEDQTYTVPEKGLAITADNSRITWIIPFQGSIQYHLLNDGIASPYIGLGIGGDYMSHHLLIQEIDIYKEQWDFSLTPEVGLLARFGNGRSKTGLLLAFNYKWTTNKIEFYQTSSDKLSMLNLKVGIVMNID